MIYRYAADAVLLLHLAFIVFAVFGGLLIVWWRGVLFLHLPALVWGVFVELTGRICPLTSLENTLRIKAGIDGYSEALWNTICLALSIRTVSPGKYNTSLVLSLPSSTSSFTSGFSITCVKVIVKITNLLKVTMNWPAFRG